MLKSMQQPFHFTCSVFKCRLSGQRLKIPQIEILVNSWETVLVMSAFCTSESYLSFFYSWFCGLYGKTVSP